MSQNQKKRLSSSNKKNQKASENGLFALILVLFIYFESLMFTHQTN